MTKESGVVRMNANGDAKNGMPPWEDMPVGGEFGGIEGDEPKERSHRVFEDVIQCPTKVRAGVWEATSYTEKLDGYPYNEIVFILEGSLSIIDDGGVEELFKPGDSFFIKKGFNGVWKQHETTKIFHMTVDPQEK